MATGHRCVTGDGDVSALGAEEAYRVGCFDHARRLAQCRAAEPFVTWARSVRGVPVGTWDAYR